jgi:hypothetical protein
MNKTKDALVLSLNSEIEKIEKDQLRPGWTRWALSGALGTCLWLLSQEVEKNLFNWHGILFPTLFLFIALDFIKDFDRLIRYTHKDVDRPRFLQIQAIGYQIRKDIALSIVLYIVLIISLQEFSFTSFYLFKTLCSLSFFFNLILLVLIFVLSYTVFPIPLSFRRKYKLIAIVPSSVLDVYLLGSMVYTLLNNNLIISVQEFRVVGLLAAIFWLLKMLFDVSEPSPLLGSLRDIRNKYSLDQIDYDAAKRQMDIALSGISVSEVMQGKVNDFVLTANTCNEYIKSNKMIYQEINQLLKNNITDKSLLVIKSLIDSAGETENKIGHHLDEMKNIATIIRSRAIWINILMPSVLEEINKIQGKLRNYVTDLDNELMNVYEIRKSINLRLEKIRRKK